MLVAAISFLALLASLSLPGTVAAEGEFPDLCSERSDNLIRNCEFNDGMSHWSSFVEAGGPAFTVESAYPACDSPKCPALRMASDASFVGGIYQQVGGLTPGAEYWANVIWLVYTPGGKADGTVGRKIGIDPTGGTDPKSANIVWSEQIWKKFDSCSYKICPELQVKAVAQSDTVTVFVRVEDTWKDRRDEFSYVPDNLFSETEHLWIDDVGMVSTGEVAAVAATATVTPTVEPTATTAPTDTPVVEEAQATEAEEAVEEATQEPTPSPTSTATATLTATPTATETPLPTETPTATPAPTRTPRPTPTVTPTATPEPLLPKEDLVAGGLACIAGLGVFGVLLVVGSVLFWLYRTWKPEPDEAQWRRKGPRDKRMRPRQVVEVEAEIVEDGDLYYDEEDFEALDIEPEPPDEYAEEPEEGPEEGPAAGPEEGRDW